jgi:hypothetical protein
MTSIFTNKSITDGNIGIGKLPPYLYPILETTAREYMYYIPDTSLTTYHSYYNNLPPLLKANIDYIQKDDLFKTICESDDCVIQKIPEMNELYYSNPKPNFLSSNLYGAAANLIPHRDCVLFRFTGISVYRMIIGLTDYNNDTITDMIYFGIEHKINRGDYMIFDFDKTLHQVRKIGASETHRILLKLHYIVCDNCTYSERYIEIVSLFYKIYYIIARYTEQLGTDPTTFIGFFFGILWEYPFYPSFSYSILFMFLMNIGLLHKILCLRLSTKNMHKLIGYSLANMGVLYLHIVLFFYLRFKIYGIK